MKTFLIGLLALAPLCATPPVVVEVVGTEDFGAGPDNQSWTDPIATSDVFVMLTNIFPNTDGVMSLTDNCGGSPGNTWEHYAPADNLRNTGGTISQLWYVLHPVAVPTGGCQVTLNCTTGATFCAMFGFHLQDVDPLLLFDTLSVLDNGPSVTEPYTTAITTHYKDELLIGFGTAGGTANGIDTASSTAGWTFCTAPGGMQGLGGSSCAYLVASGAGVYGGMGNPPEWTQISPPANFATTLIGIIGSNQEGGGPLVQGGSRR